MLPADESTYHIIDAVFLAKLRDGAVVVNAGRGGAGRHRRVACGVDGRTPACGSRRHRTRAVTTGASLWSAPGLLLTPHVAGGTSGAWERAWAIALQQISVYADGDVPPDLVAGWLSRS